MCRGMSSLNGNLLKKGVIEVTNKIQFFAGTAVPCAVYAEEVLKTDLTILTTIVGCGGRDTGGGGCGCSGGPMSLLTLDDLHDIFSDMDDYESEIYNHDTDPNAYYEAMNGVLANMGVKAKVNDSTVEYFKSIKTPIIAVNGEIISMGSIPEDYEIMDAVDNGRKIEIGGGH